MALSLVRMHCDMIKNFIDDKLKAVEPSKLVVVTAGTTIALAYLYAQLTDKVTCNISAILALVLLD